MPLNDIKAIALVAGAFIPLGAQAAQTDVVTIGQISARTDLGYTRIEIIGNTIDLGCSGSSGFVLLDQPAPSGDAVMYETLLTLTLTAKATNGQMVFITDGCATYNGNQNGVVKTLYFQ